MGRDGGTVPVSAFAPLEELGSGTLGGAPSVPSVDEGMRQYGLLLLQSDRMALGVPHELVQEESMGEHSRQLPVAHRDGS